MVEILGDSDSNVPEMARPDRLVLWALPSLKFNADLYRLFTVLKIYIIYILQINAVIIEGYVASYV